MEGSHQASVGSIKLNVSFIVNHPGQISNFDYYQLKKYVKPFMAEKQTLL